MSKERKIFWKKFFAGIGNLTDEEIVGKIGEANSHDPDFMKKYAKQGDFNRVTIA